MNVEKGMPKFSGGKNIAIKTPPHEFEQLVGFYRDVLGLKESGDGEGESSVSFCFGELTLWVDRVEGMSQAEVWLEVITPDSDFAERYLEEKGATMRGEIEALPDGFRGFWVSSPGNIVHLMSEAELP